MRRQRRDSHEEGAREHKALQTSNTKSGKIRREHRPDPFKEAKVNYEHHGTSNTVTLYICIHSNQHALFMVLLIARFDTDMLLLIHYQVVINTLIIRTCISGTFTDSERTARPLIIL